jgi:CubicO group peptidase (beta-lactamase class C family)
VSAAELDALLSEAEGHAAPSVSALVVDGGAVRYSRAPGRVYDLASLTKPLCTAELAMRALDAGRLALDAGHPLLPPGVHVRHLLQHASGWPPHRRFFERAGRREDVSAAALAEPLVHPPGAVHAYSDVGFLALGAVLEQVDGARIDALLRAAWPDHPFAWGHPDSEPTDDRRGGPVNDENARAMEGVAPHAGLFGTAEDVVRAAHRWLDGAVPMAARAFTERGPGSHTLGWDTAAQDGTSSAGPRPPPDTVGHLGFTGTSVWMSPARGRIAVLLTNRVHYGLDPARIRALRRAFHEAAWRI